SRRGVFRYGGLGQHALPTAARRLAFWLLTTSFAGLYSAQKIATFPTKEKLMKAITFNNSIVSVAILCGVTAFGNPTSASAAANKTSWKVTGELEEGCSCRPACPCWFKSLPSRMTCDGMQAIFIAKGRYGKVSLDGLAMGQFVQSPEHKSMFESFGNWNFDYVYIDDKANEEQRAALKALSGHFFPPAAKSREFRFVPISRKIEGTEHACTIGEYG